VLLCPPSRSPRPSGCSHCAQFQGVSVPPACFRVPTSQYSSVVAQFIVMAILCSAAVALNARQLAETIRPACPRWRCRRSPVAPLPAAAVHPAVDEEGEGEGEGEGTLPPPAIKTAEKPPAHTPNPYLKRARGVVFTLLLSLYGTVTSTVFNTLQCRTVEVAVRAYIRLDVDGSTLRRAGLPDDIDLLQQCDDFPFQPACNSVVEVLDRTVSVSLLASNSNAVCNESAHRMASALAVILLVGYLITFPLGLAIVLPLRLRQRLAAEGFLESWQAHVDADRRARQQWIDAVGPSKWWRALRRIVIGCCWPRIRRVDPGTLVLVPADVLHLLETSPRGAAARYRAALHVTDDCASPREISKEADLWSDAQPHPLSPPEDGVEVVADRPPAHHVRVPVVKARALGKGAVALPVYLDRFPKAFPDDLLLPASQGEFRGSQLWFHAEGALQLLAIAVIVAIVGPPASVGAAVGQALALMAVLGAVLARSYVSWPHKRGEGWHVYVSYYAQWLALLQALLNCVGVSAAIRAQDPDADPTALQSGFAGLSYFATVAALGLLVLVTVAFAEALWDAQASRERTHKPRRESV